MSKISLGAAYKTFTNSKSISFDEKFVLDYTSIDTRNLIYCNYLNLRGSTIANLNTRYFVFLLYIDVAHTNILSADFEQCSKLKKVVCDVSQNISANACAAIERLGSAAKNGVYDT